ncbi:dihydroorotase PyrC [Butyrivibrio proteoclasticus B316]|uniref:Dihydroorotase n=1 Tax=Butyrivibrio proteoclasticus (strain ATCC 51982 / DSM 14932 / B316) TaxID=515622 RepID=E0RZV5_BUTPB|nr:dihydroorotase [Butyrivibrio proteoclasticus]ADL35521.1 dihydroorotase PyrC [Butyrivibrio proteoclasticus B316]
MIIIKNGTLLDPASNRSGMYDILIDEDRIARIGACGSLDDMAAECVSMKLMENPAAGEELSEIDASGCIVAPGLVDCHVHFRDPGFTYKEDIETGARAAAKGGFTTVVMMGNTEPHMDNVATIKDVLERGSKTGIRVLTCGNVTKGMDGKELVDMDALMEAGAVLFTDDGKPVTDSEIMEKACIEAAKRNMIISLHEENPELITNNGINAGEVSEKLGITGSPREAEISMVKRDIEIAEKTGAEIVVQHISTSEAVDLIREARARGVKVHAEATPHHFTLTQDAVLKYGSLAKMNPPLRLESDRQAIIAGLQDGTIEMIATDHAPHSREEKQKELTQAPSGITGLETSLSLGIRELVNTGFLTMGDLIDRMSAGPARVYGLDAGRITEGGYADLVIFNSGEEWSFVQSVSKSSNTPFLGQRLPGKIYNTICRGKVVYFHG